MTVPAQGWAGVWREGTMVQDPALLTPVMFSVPRKDGTLWDVRVSSHRCNRGSHRVLKSIRFGFAFFEP